IIWADQRSVEQERWFTERISTAEIYRITGERIGASSTLCKILWLRDHQPDIYREAYKFGQAKDAMVARLTSKFVTDVTDASGSILYDLDQGRWSERIFEVAGLNLEQMPEVRPSTAVIGGVLPNVAEEVGVPAGTPVVIGGGDGVCAGVGAGVVKEGDAFCYIGSSAWIALATAKPIYEPEFKTNNFAHMVPGMYSPCGAMQMAGGSYAWTQRQLCLPEAQAAQALNLSPYELMNAQAGKSPAGARGLYFLPYLLGERSPYWNPHARGAFIGLTVRHTREDMIRAVLEGITFHLALIQNTFERQGAQIKAMRVIGGGARGRLWNQIMADIFGVPVLRLAILEEATSMGAALAGGVGVGLYPDFSMIESMNRVAEVFEPNPEAQQVYATMLPISQAAYQALIPVYEQMAAANSE
ncbi:MAG TPA: FGGY-family carbohydrate kinase, partial [Phototrophicaceae bacterium]|nr:FGGY-family carbohydrate kinase [Phototrophicaceae bacterium]